MSVVAASILTDLGLSATAATVVAMILMFMFRNAVRTGIEEGVRYGFSKALEEHKEQLAEALEAAKTSLKFSETRFSKQFEALVALRKYFRGIRPRKHFPDMEWDDAMGDLAGVLSNKFDELNELLSQHEAVMPTPVLEDLENALTAAEDAGFEWDWISEKDVPEPRRRAIELAEDFYNHVKIAVEAMQKTIDEQLPARKL